MSHPIHRASTVRYLGRYVSGRPMSGRRITNATWLHPGDHAYDTHARLTRWHFRPGWHRSAWRLGLPAALVSGLSAWAAAPVATEATSGALVAAGALYGSLRARRAVRVRRHTARYVRPLASTLAAQLGLPASTPVAKIVAVPLDFREPDYRQPESGAVRVSLPAHMADNADTQKALARTVAAKLGLDLADMDARWHMVGSEPYATFRRAPQPPKRVALADVQKDMRAASSAAPVFGIAARGKVISIDLDTDAPHIGVSCGSGAGKSVLIRALVAQFLHNGCQVVVNDGKRISQSWCKDLPAVTYNRRGEEMHRSLLAIAAEVDRRNDLIDSVPAELEDTIDVGPRIIIVFEEQNVGIQMLNEYWQSIRTSKDPKRSPAISALDYILCTGRQVKTHVISVAQLFTVQAAGGNPAARENYGVRILGRATRNAWMMLAPEAAPFPKGSKTRGRMHLVLAGIATEVQTVFMTVAEARDWATSGVTETATDAPLIDLADYRPAAETVTAGPPVYTLAEAARSEWCTLDYANLRQRKRRAGATWPPPAVVDGARERWTEAQLRHALGLQPAEADAA